jgi:uncharacterized protein (TIGR02246 family)
MSDNEEAVRAILARTVIAWTANDADAFADLYAEDATVMLAGGEYLRGRDEIRAYMAAGFAGRFRGSRGLDEPESVRLLGDDAAVVISLSGFSVAGGGSNSRRAAWMLSRRDGSWSVDAYANCPIAN